MRCPNCSTENETGRKFCGECGGPLALACASCGAANAPSAKFCGECGSPLTAEARPAVVPEARASTPDPVAERRLVSVLFADLVGFTTLSESQDSEEVRALLSRYFDTCKRLITLYGGTVEKFIGDAVMAVWGAPTATEDDAERAVRAALDLVAAVSALGDELGVNNLRARAGVLTGEAAVTIGLTSEGMVAGDLVNTASRVQSIASPGHVLVNDATRRATDATVVFEDAGAHELKGKVGLVPLWRALRVVSGARGSLKSQGLEAPFVGRERDLQLIKDRFHDCAEGNRALLVSVTGVAGIGKSRLAWEFYKYFDGIAQVTYWHRGRCLSYGEGVTYWALADMVRMRCRIAEEEAPASALVKLREVVEEHIADEEERRFVEPRVAHLLGLDEGSRYERDDLFAAWRVFFERLTAIYPVVMVFEDMQWADDSLLDFIEYMLEWSRDSPLFVMTLARPELQERRPTWGAGRRNFASLYLEPLSEAAMDQLLTGLVPGLPDEIHAQILGRAEGIPLYAVETVRMLLDRGLLVEDGAFYRPTGPIASLDVPETLHALIAARLDGLTPGERRVLQDASVVGKTFTPRALAALSGLTEQELEPLLTSLARKEVIAVQADPRSPEHGQYGFLQDLVRHVAYETLSKRERYARHLATAAYLRESLEEDDEIVEVLASHYLDAYRHLPDADDADATRSEAREMLFRAGRRAASLGAAREAQRYYEQAAELAEDDVARARLVDQAGRMAWLRGRGDEARRLLEDALAVFESAGLDGPAALVSAALAEIDFREGHPPRAVARLEKAVEALSSEEAGEDLAAVAAQLGRFHILNNEPDAGAVQLEQALQLAEAFELPEVFAQALTSKAMLLNTQNRLGEARLLLEGAFEHALAEELPGAAMRAANNLAVSFESGDRYADAVDLSNRGLEIARRAGDRTNEANFLAGPLSAQVLLGQWDEGVLRWADVERLAAAEWARGLAIYLVAIDCARGNVTNAREQLGEFAEMRSSDDIQLRTSYSVIEAMVLRAEGKPRAALEAAERAVAAREDLGIMFLTVKLGLVEALEAAFDLGEPAKVEELLALIENLRRGDRPPLLDAHARRFRGRLSGDEAAFNAAIARFRELEMPFWLALTELEHAESLGAQGRTDEAEELLREAREIFARLEATPWLERATGREPEASVA
jgi:class 3 adenylate cyclase/tetratricopeptide (TPR) repeat protein